MPLPMTIGRYILIVFWIVAAIVLVYSFWRIMKNTVSKYKMSNSQRDKADIVASCGIFVMGSIAMIAIFVISII